LQKNEHVTNRFVHEAKFRDLGMSIPKHGQTSTSDHRVSSKQETSSMPLLPSRKKGTITHMLNVQTREEVDDFIAQLFFAHGPPFHITHSPYFKEACKTRPSLQCLESIIFVPLSWRNNILGAVWLRRR